MALYRFFFGHRISHGHKVLVLLLSLKYLRISMVPFMQLVQDSPLDFAFYSAVLLAASCLEAYLLIYIGRSPLRYPHNLARTALISVR